MHSHDWKRIANDGWDEQWCHECGAHTIDGKELPPMSFNEFRDRSLTIVHKKPMTQVLAPIPVKPNVLAFDTETWPIGPGNVAPKIVCASFAMRGDEKAEAVLIGNGDAEFRDRIWWMLSEPGLRIVGQNIAFDLAVICRAFPEFEPRIWEKLEAGEITDTAIREKLLNLSTHGNLEAVNGAKIMYGLDALVMKHLGKDISADKEGEDAWRLNYYQLDGKPVADYPNEAIEYAQHDALYTLLVYEQQQLLVRSETGPASLSTEAFHTAAAFALYCMTVAGMAVDKEKLAEIEAMLAIELDESKLDLLLLEGIMRPSEPEQVFVKQRKKACEILDCDDSALDEMAKDPELRAALEENGIKFKAAVATSICKEKLQAKVKEVCEAYDIPIKMTDGGKSGKKQISTDSEVLDTVADWDPALAQYQHRQALQKLVTTEVPRMKWLGVPADFVHFNFDVLKETGRTSSYAGTLYPSANGQQMHPKIRPAYKARDGHALCSTDYSTLELVTTAQTTYRMFGWSKMRDLINAGVDLHGYLGGQLALKLDADFRALCVDRGIAADAMEVYKVFASLKKSDDATVREFYGHWRKFAKPVGLGFPGGLGAETFIEFAKKNYGVDIVKIAGSHENAVLLAKELKAIWLNTFPEMELYFAWVSKETFDPENPIIGYWDEPKNEEPIPGQCYTSPMGMYRAGTTYCGVANGCAMQTPAAEGAKAAVFKVVRACRDASQGSVLYGSIPVDFVHDELIVDVPLDEKTHERCMEIGRLMVEAMQLICPDVNIKAQPCLMLRWDKRAEPVFDENKRLTIWHPPQEVAA